MPNPQGVNNFDRFASEPGYGEKNRMDVLQGAAPVPGVHPLNAPRRAKRHAAGQDRPRGQTVGPVAAPPPVASPNPDAIKAEVWRELAQHPDASPLVKEIAASLG